MKQTSSRLSLATVLACTLGFFAPCAWAQTPGWVPVAELLLGSMGKSDAAMMAEVMHRCTALNMTLSVLTSNDSPETSRGYENQALRLIQNGIMIQMNTEKLRTGFEADVEQQSGIAVDAVKNMLGMYNQWMENNYQMNGSYFSNELEIEMKGCELATRFILQMSAR